jgi:membrane-bound lytic murein transglycosylase MltF
MRHTRSSGTSYTLTLALLILAMGQAVAGEYYVYKSKAGVSWYTDRRLPGDQFTLIATLGRPTASASCTGLTSRALERRARMHDAVIRQYAKIYNVDPRLVKALIQVESCFDRYAVSRVGAKGLMQLMPATAQSMGVYNVFNANDNIRGGIRYLRQMMDRFEEDMELALAAYNAGPEAVEKYQGIPPYRETRNYVKRVLDYYKRYGGAEG